MVFGCSPSFKLHYKGVLCTKPLLEIPNKLSFNSSWFHKLLSCAEDGVCVIIHWNNFITTFTLTLEFSSKAHLRDLAADKESFTAVSVRLILCAASIHHMWAELFCYWKRPQQNQLWRFWHVTLRDIGFWPSLGNAQAGPITSYTYVYTQTERERIIYIAHRLQQWTIRERIIFITHCIKQWTIRDDILPSPPRWGRRSQHGWSRRCRYSLTRACCPGVMPLTQTHTIYMYMYKHTHIHS